MNAFWVLLLISILHQGVSGTVCTDAGRFPNNTRPDCRGYTMCLKGATSVTNYDLVCPDNSIYSHIENQCTNVTSYQCLSNYTCPQEGNFEYDPDTDCSLYVTCIKDLSNTVSARLVKCSENMAFDRNSSLCVNETLLNCRHETPKTFEVKVNDVSIATGNIPASKGTYIRGVILVLMCSLLFLSLIN